MNVCFFCNYISGDYQLGAEQRLYDFGFFAREEIDNIIILPPHNKELVDIMAGNRSARYIGKIWGDI